ncbi:hypothetical protein R6Q59_016383 [Mikania micrantha]|uniref:DUF4216 domain-containing protein n=1 Tax=Mikania micrantha TaxID=192012 RepID=A0A5N6PL90_9ASTR|nr:hypothetical protein E3N88_09883 [Mikania micrantha]
MTLDKSWTKIPNKVDPMFIKGAMDFAERGKKYVEPHFISVDTSRSAYKEDPFIFASQAQQAFYINDSLKPNSQWKIIERITHRHLWDIPEDMNGEDLLEDINLLREDIADEIVENVDVQVSDANKDDFIDDDIDNSDYSMEDSGSELNLDDSETEKHNSDNEIVESDDDDDDDW